MSDEYRRKLETLKAVQADFPEKTKAIEAGERALELMAEEGDRAPRSAEWAVLNDALALVDVPSGNDLPEPASSDSEPVAVEHAGPTTEPQEPVVEPTIVEATGTAAGASTTGN